MQEKPIQVPAIFSGLSTRVDRGASLRFATNEVSPEDIAKMSKHIQKFGWLLFKASESEEMEVKPFTESELPQNEPDFNRKSQSQKIRGLIFKLFLREGAKGQFETFYYEMTEKYIAHLKSKLDL